ncbi:conserved hypothetical protein [Theileria orientalis strain Shintoku]|uniref:Uncharacterized protein n=1 Tax=Theileria orientalis strain Shintoku TaxID=869250 RepID=J4C375_THEOR|nr:conserved hypothetical protein [Theileria orientalis strain Shintoku]BAM39951.1 conserved hypothetical protein [Theileria orientalis strain Shintoku]|eukprot:XP_009690252.1 conserved hypothetical protein [Theileria orientalis strain Shintoku]
MLPLIRFIFICVIVFLSKSPVLTDLNFVEVNIANLSSELTKSKKKNYDHIVVSEEAKLDNKCVGRVIDSTLIISENPDPKATYRYVRVVKYPKTGDHNPDLEEAVKHDTLEYDQSEQVGDDSQYFKTVEIHTFFDNLILLDRYAKNTDGHYVNFDFTQVEVDICQDITEIVEIDGSRYYKVQNYHTVGAIKCGATVLLDGLNVFYRTIKVHDRKVVVNTVPKFGLITDVTFDLGKDLKQVTTQATGRKLMTLRLDRLSASYQRMLSTCGNDCLFYDGCNEKTVLVNVQEAENVIYSNKNTLCISVKVEEFAEAKYVTIYDKPRNSNYYIVTILRRGANEISFTKHKKTSIEVDVTDVPKTKDPQYSALLIGESVTPNARYRIKNIDYRIGNLYMGGNLLLGDADIIFNREIYTNEKGIMVFDQYYNGESNKYLFRPTGGDPKNPSTLNRAGKALHLLPEYVVKVDLNNITANVTKYGTVSGENLFVRTNSFVEKLGSLTYNTFMVCPNRFYVSNQYMIMNDKEMKLYSVTRRGYGFLESFVKVDSFFQGEKTFVSKAKEVVTFDIMEFYTWINDMMMESLTGFEIKFMGDYYMVGMRYKYLFGKMLGNIEVKGKVIAPLDTDLSSRELLLPTNTQSFFILRDCDTLDCWHRTYKESSANGYIGYEIQQKVSLPMDILKIYQNDKGQTVFTFDHFVVYKYGTVYNVRVLNDLEHKIGKIQFNGHDLLQDDAHVFTRMVNVSVKTENNVDVNGAAVLGAINNKVTVTGLLRILEIEKWDKTTKLYSYQINQTQGFQASVVAKKNLELDLEPLVRTDTNLNISARDDVYNYQVNWNNRDDYVLTKIKCSHYVNNGWVPYNLIENLSQFPVFVRLHKDENYDTNRTVSLAIENHHGFAKPKSGQLFTLETNADKKGILLKYSLRDKSSKHMRNHTVDSYYRRNFTSHRHTFHVEPSLAATQTVVTQPTVPASQGVPVAQHGQAGHVAYAGQGLTGAQPGQAAAGTRTPQGPTPLHTGQGIPTATSVGTGGQRGKTFKLDDSDEEK